MITEFSGKNNQIVTTWGRDLDDKLVWSGLDRPRKWECTCRCGKTCQGSDFGTLFLVKTKGWEAFNNEAFCSIVCSNVYVPFAVTTEVINLQNKIDSLSLRIKDLLDSK